MTSGSQSDRVRHAPSQPVSVVSASAGLVDAGERQPAHHQVGGGDERDPEADPAPVTVGVDGVGGGSDTGNTP